MSQEIKAGLLTQLSEFGLNPSDWQFWTWAGVSKCQLVHRLDPELRLLGKITDGRWLDLAILD